MRMGSSAESHVAFIYAKLPSEQEAELSGERLAASPTPRASPLAAERCLRAKRQILKVQRLRAAACRRLRALAETRDEVRSRQTTFLEQLKALQAEELRAFGEFQRMRQESLTLSHQQTLLKRLMNEEADHSETNAQGLEEELLRAKEMLFPQLEEAQVSLLNALAVERSTLESRHERTLKQAEKAIHLRREKDTKEAEAAELRVKALRKREEKLTGDLRRLYPQGEEEELHKQRLSSKSQGLDKETSYEAHTQAAETLRRMTSDFQRRQLFLLKGIASGQTETFVCQ